MEDFKLFIKAIVMFYILLIYVKYVYRKQYKNITIEKFIYLSKNNDLCNLY